MAIPETQFQTWANQGAVATSSSTYTSVQTALSASTSLIRDRITGGGVELYLQGSYKNDTNIRGDSDVDVVVQLNTTFQYDYSVLPLASQQSLHQTVSAVTYPWHQFRADVLASLRSYYGQARVSDGNKALRIAAAPGRLECDVVVALQYRRYTRFQSIWDQEMVEGIAFWEQNNGRMVVNYPKQHYDNGVSKNSRYQTNGWYKPVVRMFKNARTYLEDRGRRDLAPSFFLEGLLHNVPSMQFGPSYRDSFCNAVNWLSQADLSQLWCQNGQVLLCGPTPEQWSVVEARTFLNAMIELWNSWT